MIERLKYDVLTTPTLVTLSVLSGSATPWGLTLPLGATPRLTLALTAPL